MQLVESRIHSPSVSRQIGKSLLSALLPRRLFLARGSRRGGAVCLTFDDGPHPEHTPRLLDVLHDLEVPGTFFLIGKNVERYPELVRRIAAEGHAVGHHTFHHSDPRRLSAAGLVDEIDRTNALFMAILGRRSAIFRPPWGKLTAAKLLRLWAAGQKIVLWSADPRDCECETTEEVRDWFHRHPAQAGDIVLMHDDHPYAADVLPEVIEEARRRGLRFGAALEWRS